MQMMIFILLLLLFPSVCFGEIDSSAVQSADTFLEGIKLAYRPEGREMISKTSWFNEKQYPLYSEIIALSEGMFSTDVPHVEGYMKLMQITELTGAGSRKKKKYLLLSYRDTFSGEWKIFDFREFTDTELEALIACKDPDCEIVAGGEVLRSAQYNYFQCGYWSTLAGKLLRAREAFLKALELNEKKPDKNISQKVLENYMESIKRIIGK
jgi:hypothetical protein